jgi:hypothetical protein
VLLVIIIKIAFFAAYIAYNMILYLGILLDDDDIKHWCFFLVLIADIIVIRCLE